MKSYAFLIVGGGIVAGHAAEVFAQSDNYRDGDLAIISADSALPYDRTQLSKSFLDGEKSRSDIQMHDRSYYANQGIDVYLDTKVVSIDPVERIVYTEHDNAYAYGELLLATGSSPNRFNIDGVDLEGIYYLRHLNQSQEIRQAMEDANDIVVIGGGYIGMEVAADKAKNVTMIYPEKRLMEHRFFTEEMSEFFENEYKKHGVTLVNEAMIKEFRGEDGHVSEVRTNKSGHIKADLVIAGIGVTPNTDLVKNLDIQLAEDGSIEVDAKLRTTIEHISAAGDIANYPDNRYNKRLRVPHWDNAVDQGEYWASLMLGETEDWFDSIPYFFSDVFDLSYEFWGHAEDADEVIHRSDLDDGSFSVWWLKDKRVQAAFLLDRPDEARTMAPELIKSQNDVDRDALKDESTPIYAVE